jgi:hypothetical protein
MTDPRYTHCLRCGKPGHTSSTCPAPTPTCGTCQHHDLKRTTSYGMAPCAQELGAYRLARHFAPTAPCNKAKHKPTATERKG